MPYIIREKRGSFDPVITELVSQLLIDPENLAGNLNYVLTATIRRYQALSKRKSYKDYNELIGALECCKLELYRKEIACYEDQKETENGEVF